MIYTLKIVFGKGQVIKAFNNIPFTKEELEINVKEYNFNSQEEKEAFLKGINEAIGWTECCIPELELCER
ncbi:MAG: hypothetical protein ACOYU1_05130 [Bacteroidota bacterium]|jgi:cytochrome c biogenesis protein CcdA